jgi:Amt family ammonium transporter
MCRKNQISLTNDLIVLWSTFIYMPIAHWVWNPDGWLRGLGSIDFAGGIVVHISAGISALAAALVVGRRKGCAVPWQSHMKAVEQKDHATEFKPTNVPYVILGAPFLWFGWFVSTQEAHWQQTNWQY